jgi:hypothetical protein
MTVSIGGATISGGVNLGDYVPVVRTGLQMQLDAGNTSSYSGSGSTWTDLSGNGNNATLFNTPTYSSSNSGYLTFNGTNQEARTSLFNNAITNVTMQVWINVTLSTVGCYFGNGTDSGGYHLGISQYFTTPATNAREMLYGNVRWVPTGTTYTSGWQLLTMALDGSSTPYMYVNGTFIGSYPGTAPITPSPGSGFCIGSQWGIRYSQMSVSAAYFYNRLLNSNEVDQNFQALRGRYAV